MRYNYNDEKMSCVKVKGIPCEFTDIRLEKSTILEGKLLYEVADGEGGKRKC